MPPCCQNCYDVVFDRKKALEDLESYRKGGIKKNSLHLLQALKALPLEGHSLLDIGGGIGALIFELAGRGIREATHIELSSAYAEVFLEQVKEQKISIPIQNGVGDFISLAAQVEPASLVTLDKVICCYEEFEALVRTSVGKAQRWYAYTVPRDLWWVRWANQLERLAWIVKGKPLKTYVHPTARIEELVCLAGFRKISQAYQREWMAVLYEKEPKLPGRLFKMDGFLEKTSPYFSCSPFP